jgi:hypothetical protein
MLLFVDEVSDVKGVELECITPSVGCCVACWGRGEGGGGCVKLASAPRAGIMLEMMGEEERAAVAAGEAVGGAGETATHTTGDCGRGYWRGMLSEIDATDGACC